MTEFSWQLLGTMVAGWFVFVAGIGYGRSEWPRHPPRCPYCNSRLRPVMVMDLTYPIPEGAKWTCPGSFWWQLWFPHHIRRYFADHPAAKPAPVEEV